MRFGIAFAQDACFPTESSDEWLDAVVDRSGGVRSVQNIQPDSVHQYGGRGRIERLDLAVAVRAGAPRVRVRQVAAPASEGNAPNNSRLSKKFTLFCC